MRLLSRSAGAACSLSAQLAHLAGFIWRHPANRGRRWRTLARGVAWQAYKRITGKAIVLHVFGGCRFRCYPDSHPASLLIYASGWPDHSEMAFMRTYLRRGDAFIDVGANVGVYTILAAALVGASGRVEAYEPDPLASSRLLENLSLNGFGHAHVHRGVVSNHNGSLAFLTGRDAENRVALPADDRGSAVDRPCTTLDDHLPPGRYAMGKMDIEGAEAFALGGSSRLLADANPPVWLLEFNPSMRAYGWDEQALADWLSDRGFDLALYDETTHRLSSEPQPWTRASNVLAVNRHRRGDVEHRLLAGRQPAAVSSR